VIELKLSKFGVISLLLFGMIIGLTGIVCADPGVNATPETQSLSTMTTVDVVGLATETDAGTWTLTNDPLVLYTFTTTSTFPPMDPSQYATIQAQLQAAGGGLVGPPGAITQINIPESLLNEQITGTGNTYQKMINKYTTQGYVGSPVIMGAGIHTGALHENQVQYTTAYDANIVAQGGKTSFVRQMNIDTRNKVTSQSNLKTQTGLTFAATDDGGNVVGSENLMLDGAGDLTYADERMLCPFVSSADAIIPAFCNIVQSGGKFDLTIGSVTTSADERFVGTSSTDPVVMNYAINIKPYGTSQGQFPASGSAMAYLKAHVQEARDWDWNLPVEGMNKSADLTYTETASALGTITSFNKDMHYTSQITSVAIRPPPQVV
jgi:hypothetical protein